MNVRKKPSPWEAEETECLLAILKELHVIELMDGKRFRTSDIFKKVEGSFNAKGYNRTNAQLLEKFKALKKRYINAKNTSAKSGAGSDAKVQCPFYEELDEIFGYRPTVNQDGVDSTILPPDLENESSGYCESEAEINSVISNNNSSQKRRFSEGCSPQRIAENTSHCTNKTPPISHRHDSPSFRTSQHQFRRANETPTTSLSQKSPSSCTSKRQFSPPSPASSQTSNERYSRSTPICDLDPFDDSDKSQAPLRAKQKISKPLTSSKREAPRSSMKYIMHDFAETIMQSQENLLAKTIAEQRKLDKEMVDQYSKIFMQQTQMMIAGLQSLRTPIPGNLEAFHQYPGVAAISSPLNPLQNVSYNPYSSIPANAGFQESTPKLPPETICSKKVLYQPDQYNQTTCNVRNHETQLVGRDGKEMTRFPKFTTKPLPKLIRPQMKSHCPSAENINIPLQESTNPVNSSHEKQNETEFELHEDDSSSDIEYEDVEYLDFDLKK